MADVVGLYRRFGVRLPELGDGWASTRCFSGAHQDRHPSARVHLQKGTFRCFSCGARGGVLDALELLGVHDRQEAWRLAVDYGILDPPKRKPRSRPIPLGVRVRPSSPAVDTDATGRVDYDHLPDKPAVVHDRTWTYTNAEGHPVGRVRRLDLANGQKRIWQERQEAGTWKPGLEGEHLPLYRLPQVLERARAGERVVVVEGEKAVDALDRLGVFATTNAAGAGKWRYQDTQALAGATVQAIADCDLPGRLHAIRLSMDCLLAGIPVLAPLDPSWGANDGFDIVDHLAGVAQTIHATAPELPKRTIRARLYDHLRQLLNQSVLVNGAELQRRLELANYYANPDGHAYIDCHKCGQRRVHRVSYGIAFCPCGGHRLEP